MMKGKLTTADILYDCATWLFNIMLDVFFREIRPRGSHKIPKEGPLIFVAAPHANQFVDPLIVMRECHRRVSFLIAAKSMRQKAIRFFANMVHAIPVERPQDLAETGKGRIQLLNSKTDPLRITGIDTKFTQQLRPTDSIVLPRSSGKLQVAKVISDTELLISEQIKDRRALEFLVKEGGTAYKCLPHIDQDTVYERVYSELNNGQCITIFPEGGSHDRVEMLPLKAGVTIMALGAMAKYPGLDVKIVPCGLNYFHAHKFRSRAVIEFGKPITISPDLVEQFKKGGQAKREACSSLLDTIFYALKSVTVNTPNEQTLMVIQAARRLYKPAHRRLHIAQVVDLNRRFVIGYNLYKDDPRVIDLQQKVLAYNQLLKYNGLKDHQVPEITIRRWRTFFLLCYRIMIFTVWGLLSFPGSILNLPIVTTAKLISMKKAKEALASSSVKVRARDVLATWKLLVGLVLIPSFYGLYTLIVFWLCLKADYIGWLQKILFPAITWTLLPFVSYASMRFAENGIEVFKSLRPLYVALIDPDSSAHLREIRERLSEDITKVINEIGPLVFSDFDPNNVFRSDSTSKESVSELGSGGRTFSQVANEFLTGTAKVLMDDTNIFNWTRQEVEDLTASESENDLLYLLDKEGSLQTTTSASETENFYSEKRRRNRSKSSRRAKLA
ncbi:glycerol-3-phosphate/dihydroxyacetone phosphate dual substrate-specific sn-1 acyltransferase [Rhizopus microsporus ATCC 52813]|uniref:Glycerol-3-phosphate/dihydroxyacetone phosphate dual substrate-specific sn-1 acyltransferase n=1 Tax=Rhizopus microsporus ATCC 52813 TaxID=1340429 RepID=A0A2G4SWR8_RHIZD|nr:glycerol-3-phosphate/dihydroxyacetone phosphate dual substrate-specific sn-1 acyltransferase [Rhizopus microsporus ATCC 52813]PHZ13219.1 glycerol-3-phosphate/dihydroxyacetone phosphate dual substrate-specific sn-1 acyltransferase [Rhizopus microsporus ATCC 52813]